MTTTPPRQTVSAVAGAAYGVIGADLHVFDDGTPIYLPQRWQPPVVAPAAWLGELPSRMLNARHEVVPFTGRAGERGVLHQWRRDEHRLSARWLQAPGGQGKTRLAAQFAQETAGSGWLVVHAVHGLGSVLPSPSAQDLDPDGAAGVLLIVDYADRWPVSHLSWLFGNGLLHRPGLPARILLLARSADSWPGVQAALADHHASPSSMMLGALPQDAAGREEMFHAARDGFAAVLGLADPAAIGPPGPLTAQEMGLTLAVHMAALVAVDATLRDRRPPADLASLTSYLIDREHLHWTNLHGGGRQTPAPAIATPPDRMRQAVLVAVLSGATSRAAGRELIARLPVGGSADRLLDDHAVCYPPSSSDASTVLEPLYPDRLAEDFLALSLPGHAADYPYADWSQDLATRALDGLRSIAGLSPARAIVFLAAAAERWPHVGAGYLYPLLREDPQLYAAGGSVALSAVAALGDVDMDVLRAVAPLLPVERHVDLDAGAAAVTTRLTRRQLAETDDPGRRGQLHGLHGWRLAHAGHHAQALQATTAAASEYRRAAAVDPDVYLPLLAASLNNICAMLSELGRQDEARPAARESVELRRRLAENDPLHLPSLALALNTYGLVLAELGELRAALEPAVESVDIRRRVAEQDPQQYEGVASSLTNLGLLQARLGDLDDALESVSQAVGIYRKLADDDGPRYLPDLAAAVNNQGSRLAELDRVDDALAAFDEGVQLRRDLVRRNETANLPSLAAVLNNRGNALARSGRTEEALASTREAAEIYRAFSVAHPDAYLRQLAWLSLNLGNRLAELGRRGEADEAYAETVRIRRRLAAANPAAYEEDLARSLIVTARFKAADAAEGAQALSAAEEAIGRLERIDPRSAAVQRALAEAKRVREEIMQVTDGSPAPS